MQFNNVSCIRSWIGSIFFDPFSLSTNIQLPSTTRARLCFLRLIFALSISTVAAFHYSLRVLQIAFHSYCSPNVKREQNAVFAVLAVNNGT